MSITEQFKQVFSNDYCGFDSFFSSVLAPLFGNRIERKNENLLADGRYRDKAERLKIKTMTFVAQVDAFESIDVIDITVDNSCRLERSRVYIKELVRQMIDYYTQAFIVFHYANTEGEAWRFSYIYKEGKQTDVTPAKRFTYVFGRGYSGRTAAERFATLQGKPIDTADDFKAAFSVETLSDEFFNKYKQQYERFCQFLYENKANTDFFGEAFTTWNDKVLRDYVKKMLGRLVFIQFLHRKGWAPNLLDAFNSHPELQDNFLDAYLEPLFGGVLNTQSDRRADEFRQNAKRGWSESLIAEFEKVPYLNGGLFESDVQDPPRSRFPKEFFRDLFEFFAQYNFTVDENDPQEAEIGVDPEMLGRIFENLLEDNKDKGAFYTPKEIVEYMCRESLIAYLNEKLTSNDQNVSTFNFQLSIRTFVTTHVLPTELHSAANEIKTALYNVKICDPAIGSGAFPMDLLNELVALHEVLGNENEEIQQRRADIKKHIIQNSIYGVDIEKGAVDIARLRFWLSIVVDEDVPQALPNLDYKIMQGNSLLEQYEGISLDMRPADGTLDYAIAERTELQHILTRYYNTADHQRKQQLRSNIQTLVQTILIKSGYSKQLPPDLDLGANPHFFLWHTWFADVFEKGGFDIVIGNPPYVKEYTNRSAFDGFRETSPYYMGKMDLWYGFACQGIDLLKDNGTLCFIAQNNWTTSAGAKKMREKVVKDCQILQMLDFNTYMVFDSADIQTMIMLFKRNHDIDNYFFDYRIITQGNDKDDMLSLLSKQERNTNYLSPSINRESLQGKLLTFSSNDYLFEQIAKNKTYLQDDEVAQGIVFPQDFLDKKGAKKLNDKYPVKTGIFGLSQSEKESMTLNDNELKLIQPYFTTEQIHRFYTEPQNTQWLIYTDSSFKRTERMNNYPNIKKHIDRFIDILTSDNKPYGLHRSRKQSFFQGEKIISLRKCVDKPCFSYSAFDCYVTQTFFSIKSSRWDMKFLTGLLNSTLVAFWLKHKGKMQGNNYQVDKEPLQSIPLPIIEIAQQQPIIELVEKILAAKKADPAADTSTWEAEIDNLVYNLYGLTEEDVRVVKGE